MHEETAIGPMTIDPVPVGVQRPYWSVMIPTYNCARYLAETLRSVLAQDYGSQEMQIEVVDDSSTNDDPEMVVNEIGKGRVSFFRNHMNLGATANFNNCLRRARGKYIHILHGDDYVGPTFYSFIRKMIDGDMTCGIYATRSFFMDNEGALEGISPKYPIINPIGKLALPYAQDNHFLFPGIVINRSCVEKTGGFNERFCHVADWELWIRLIYHHGARLSNICMGFYRLFEQNDSSRHRRTGNNLREMKLAFQLFSNLLPELDKVQFENHLRRMAFNQYNMYLRRGDHEAAQANYFFWKSVTSLRGRLVQNAISFAKKIGVY